MKNTVPLTTEINNSFVGTTGAFLSFFLFGFLDNLKGPTISPLLQEFGFNYTEGGTIFLGEYLGFFIAVLFAGMVCGKIGNKIIIILGSIFLVVGAIIYSYSGFFVMLVFSMIIIGLGLGSIEVGGNALIINLHMNSNDKGKYLLLLGFFHSGGSMIGPIFAGQLMAGSISWRSIYQYSAILVVLSILFYVFVRIPKTDVQNTDSSLSKMLNYALSKTMAWYYLLISAYVGIEVGIASWIIEYLQKYKSLSISASTTYLSLFFGGIMAGRFLGSFIVEKVGYLRIMLYATCLSIACVLLGTFGPKEVFYFLPLSGFFLSIIFPTATAAFSAISEEDLAIRLGVFLGFAGLGGMLGPWILGIMSDMVGINFGFTLGLIGFCILMLVSLIGIQTSMKHLKN